MEWAFFALVALGMLVGGFKIVTGSDLVRSVLWLGVVLVATAGAFVLLRADIVAAIQIMLYTGGVITLMLFGVMLSRKLEGAEAQITSHGRPRAAVAAALVLGLLLYPIFTSELPATPLDGPSADAVGELFLTRHLLAFEALSVLLLAAMIGAIVIARRKDPS